MRTILVNLEISPVLDSALQCALLVAQRFGSYIEGLHMRPGQPDIIAAGADGFVAAAPDLVASFEREARERAERARTTFEAFMAQHALPRATGLPPGGGVCADWRIEVTSGHGAIGSLGRVFDLVVMGRPLAEFGGAQHGRARDRPVRERPTAADCPADPARRSWASTS